MPDIRPRRSALYVPGSRQRAIDKAPSLGADVLILDLEDSVAPSEKGPARQAVAEAVPRFRASGVAAELVIRVNAVESEWAREDLRLAVAAKPDAVLLPKLSGRNDLDRARAAIRAAAGADVSSLPSLFAMIETPRAALDPLAIADAADPELPLLALVLGVNDLAHALRLRDVPGRAPVLPFLAIAIAAARAAGLDILDGVFNEVSDSGGFAAECRQGRNFGFDGKTLIHPGQVAPCNTAFSPSEEEIAGAERIVAAFDLPANRGLGAVNVDGRMVERLHAESARRLLALGRRLGLKARER